MEASRVSQKFSNMTHNVTKYNKGKQEDRLFALEKPLKPEFEIKRVFIPMPDSLPEFRKDEIGCFQCAKCVLAPVLTLRDLPSLG